MNTDYQDDFYRKIESIIADLDDVAEDYQLLELFDCEPELLEARETLAEILYKITRF